MHDHPDGQPVRGRAAEDIRGGQVDAVALHRIAGADPGVLGHPFFVMEFVDSCARTDAQGLDAVLRAWLGCTAGCTAPLEPIGSRCSSWASRGLLTKLRAVADRAGDPGPDIALREGTGIPAVIVWELAYAGDAAENLAYLALIRDRLVPAAVEGPGHERRGLRRASLASLDAFTKAGTG